MPKRSFSSGKIDSNGMLHVSRIANLKLLCCPYGETAYTNGVVKNAYCGDWCPLFSELSTLASKKVVLEICQDTTMVFNSFSDERT